MENKFFKQLISTFYTLALTNVLVWSPNQEQELCSPLTEGNVSYLTELSVPQNHGGHQGPHVEGHTHPGGHDLDPHRRHVGIQRLKVRAWTVPVGEGHHHVEGGQGQHEVEEGVTVGHCVFLIVPHMLLTLLFISRIRGT